MPGRTIDWGILPNLLGFNLRRAQVAAFADFNASVGRTGLTPGLVGVLALIEANPGLKQSELAVILGIDRSTLVPVLDKLERRGLVVRRPMPGDRRAHALELTAGGGAALRRVVAEIRRHEARIARGLSAAERTLLIRLLGRVGGPGRDARLGARGRTPRKP